MGPVCVCVCVQASRYRFYRNGAVTVYINGVRVHQTARGEVIVASGRKYLRVSPRTGLSRVVTHFVEMTVEQNWTVRVRRGGHRLLGSAHLFILANDTFEFGLDQFQRPFLQPVSERQETIICRLGLLKGQLQHRFFTVSTKKLYPCIRYHKSGKQRRILTKFYPNIETRNCKQVTKFQQNRSTSATATASLVRSLKSISVHYRHRRD